MSGSDHHTRVHSTQKANIAKNGLSSCPYCLGAQKLQALEEAHQDVKLPGCVIVFLPDRIMTLMLRPCARPAEHLEECLRLVILALLPCEGLLSGTS